jgi:hypothetical protein
MKLEPGTRLVGRCSLGIGMAVLMLAAWATLPALRLLSGLFFRADVRGLENIPASGPVLTATSDRHVVTIALDVSYESEVKAGDAVSVTLPDGTTTPGVVSSVGTVATTSGSGAAPAPATTIPVTVSLSDPKAAGTLDQASGAYVVEVAGPGNTRRWVPVTAGPVFDGAGGLVQVTGALRPGQRVVVAAS